MQDSASWGHFYLLNCGYGVTACHGKTEVDARWQEELHGDLFTTLLLPRILQVAVNPRRHCSAGRSSMGNCTAQSTQMHSLGLGKPVNQKCHEDTR